MKHRSKLAALAGLALAAAGLSPVAVAGPPQHRLPDLVITQYGLTSWGQCAPNQVLFNMSMTVKNQGMAGWSGPSNVFVRDLKKPGWFTSVELQPLAPGQSRTLNVPVYYYLQDPGFMQSGSPHPFQATVNDAPHMPVESNYANNAGPGPAMYMGKHVIMVAPTKNCATHARPHR